MGIEIERKFLVKNKAYQALAPGVLYRQGYISSDMDRVVRVRTAGEKGFLTIKGKNVGAVRPEFEYEIPITDAHSLLDSLCSKPIVEKIRYSLPYQGAIWEVDEFLGENAGLIVAEIELDSEDEVFELPPWVGQEVTSDHRYYNVNLAKKPYSSWKE